MADWGLNLQYPVQLGGQRTVFKVQLYNPNSIDPDELRKLFATNEAVQRADVDPCLVALNTLMVHGFGLLYPANKSTFFINDPAKIGLTKAHQPFDVTGGVELWRQRDRFSLLDRPGPDWVLIRRRLLHLAAPDHQISFPQHRHDHRSVKVSTTPDVRSVAECWS